MPGKGGIPWNKGISKYPLLMDREALYQKYWVEGLTEDKIGESIGCCGRHVGFWMRKLNIPHRNTREAWNKGKELSEDHRRKIGKSQQGEKNYFYGKHFTGEKNAMYGKRHSEETKQKIREKRKHQILPKSHTNIECIYWDISKHNNLNSEYTADGSFWIGRVNTDFIIKAKRVAIFINGDYWHSPLLRPTLTYTQRVEVQIKECKKHKWKAIIIWGIDLERKDAEQFVLSLLKKEGII